MISLFVLFFFFKQKTAYEMRISDWSSDVCSSDLRGVGGRPLQYRAGRNRPFSGAAGVGGNHSISPDRGGDRIAAAGWRRPRQHRKGCAGAGSTSFRRVARLRRRLECGRSEKRRGGNGGVSTCRSRWSKYPKKK